MNTTDNDSSEKAPLATGGQDVLVCVDDYTFPKGWNLAVNVAARARHYCEQLEAGRVLYFCTTPYVLFKEDLEFLRSRRQTGSPLHKNVSYRPAPQDVLRGAAGSAGEMKRLQEIMRNYSEEVTRFVKQLLTPYAPDLVLDYASFRPEEEAGRRLPVHKRNDLLHVDAFPTRPMNGHRILRSFTNIHPTASRVWNTTDGFPVLAQKYAQAAGLAAIAADGTVYACGKDDNTLYAITTNGSLAWSHTTGGAIISSPAIGPDGTVYVASEDGNLYAFWGSAPPATNGPWPMFQHDAAHTGQAPPTAVSNYCGAPFVFNGDNDGVGDFFFSMTGPPGSSNWNVYASTNLSSTNWTLLATNLKLDPVTGNTNFIDPNVAGLSQRFYIVSRSNCCSKAIGFVNLTIARGTNLIADQLYQVDENALLFTDGSPMNTLNSLVALSWGSAQAGTEIFKWNGTGFEGDTNGGFGDVAWVGPGDLTILPGTGVLMVNKTGTPFTSLFIGLVREQQVFQTQPGTNYLSATAPLGGTVTNITGYVPHNGDTIKLWNTTSNAYVSYPYSSNIWTHGSPTVGVGAGFVLITTNSYSWTNTWEQCP